MKENKNFLKEQIITYLGNKRNLLEDIGKCVEKVKEELGKEKLDLFDAFSGSGIVSRFFKQHANKLYVNDLENYAKTISKCYLINSDKFDKERLDYYFHELESKLTDDKLDDYGFIREMYSPKDEKNITFNDRVFYTVRNAKYIDTARRLLEEFPEPYKTLFLGNLIYEASTKTNTCGVFKGFYKDRNTKNGKFGGTNENALSRIKKDIYINKPVFSQFDCDVNIFQGDAYETAKKVSFIDLAYFDPPYNQHPYGSNYFMLNLINDYQKPTKISNISGIPANWNKSKYNVKSAAFNEIKKLCNVTKAKYILISYNSEGFISKEEMKTMLNSFGSVEIYNRKYNAFRGSRNLKNRSIYTKEYLFLLRKEKI